MLTGIRRRFQLEGRYAINAKFGLIGRAPLIVTAMERRAKIDAFLPVPGICVQQGSLLKVPQVNRSRTPSRREDVPRATRALRGRDHEAQTDS